MYYSFMDYKVIMTDQVMSFNYQTQIDNLSYQIYFSPLILDHDFGMLLLNIIKPMNLLSTDNLTFYTLERKLSSNTFQWVLK